MPIGAHDYQRLHKVGNRIYTAWNALMYGGPAKDLEQRVGSMMRETWEEFERILTEMVGSKTTAVESYGTSDGRA